MLTYVRSSVSKETFSESEPASYDIIMTATAISMATKVAYDLSQALERPSVRGKFLFVSDRKFYVKGATYGTFRPDGNGDQFPETQVAERDLQLMAANGINAVRTYT